jgi:hypothetical protein
MSYGFMMLAFAAHIASIFLAFKKAYVEAVFFGLPLASLSVYYLVAELCVSAIFMIYQVVGTTIPLVIQAIMLAGFAVVAIIAIMARDTAQAISDTVERKVAQHKAFSVDVDVLLAGCTDAALKPKLRKLSEIIKYSDPMSNDAVADVEQRILQKVAELGAYCESNEAEEAGKTCSAIELLYVERNKKLLVSK